MSSAIGMNMRRIVIAEEHLDLDASDLDDGRHHASWLAEICCKFCPISRYSLQNLPQFRESVIPESESRGRSKMPRPAVVRLLGLPLHVRKTLLLSPNSIYVSGYRIQRCTFTHFSAKCAKTGIKRPNQECRMNPFERAWVSAQMPRVPGLFTRIDKASYAYFL